MAASISPGAKRKIPVPNETGKFQEKSLDFSPKQGKYNTILEKCQSADQFPKTKIENNIRRIKPGNDQKRGNQTIVIKAAWHKQMTDIERQQNGGMIERRPIPVIA